MTLSPMIGLDGEPLNRALRTHAAVDDVEDDVVDRRRHPGVPVRLGIRFAKLR